MITNPTPAPDSQRIKALMHLDTILSVVGQMDDQDQRVVADLAKRILRLALQGEHLGPFAMTLANAQMAVDFTASPPEGEAPESRLVGLNGETLQ